MLIFEFRKVKDLANAAFNYFKNFSDFMNNIKNLDSFNTKLQFLKEQA